MIFRKKIQAAANYSQAIANPFFRMEAAMSQSAIVGQAMSESAIVGQGMSESAIVGLLLFGALLIILLLVFAGIAFQVWWHSRQEAHRAEREIALKKEFLDRGLSVDEIERLIRATAEPPKQPVEIDDEDVDALGELGGLLGRCEPDAKPEAIEEILAIARIADTKMKRAMVSAVEEMHEVAGTITDEQIRAAVRALARPAGPSTQSTAPTNDLPPLAGTASRITDAFQLPK
jgi:hypothetical protein